MGRPTAHLNPSGFAEYTAIKPATSRDDRRTAATPMQKPTGLSKGSIGSAPAGAGTGFSMRPAASASTIEAKSRTRLSIGDHLMPTDRKLQQTIDSGNAAPAWRAQATVLPRAAQDSAARRPPNLYAKGSAAEG